MDLIPQINFVSPSLDHMNDSYSPKSPKMKANDDEDDTSSNSNLDDFEFVTSKKFGMYIQFDDNECHVINLLARDKTGSERMDRKPRHERGGSLPTMAFADELFLNGKVMPLKLPPRLHVENQSCTPSPPKFPISPKIPFFHRPALWNDDFDPFMVALHNVAEENRGRRSSNAGKHHRSSRSHSPFRTPKPEWCKEGLDIPLDNIENDPFELEKNGKFGPKKGPLKEPKDRPYARWGIGLRKVTARRVRPVENDPGGHNGKNTRGKIRNHEGVDVLDIKSNKGIRGILRRYASFGKENNEEKSKRKWRASYLKKLSFKFKGKRGGDNGKKRVIEATKISVVEYKGKKPTLPLCFYGIESPRIMR